MVYDEHKIWQLYSANYRAATRKLKQLQVFCGNEPRFPGLGGWVYEQTVQYCIRRELRAKRVKVEISEQAKLGSRRKADLLVEERAAVEIKLSGLFSTADVDKYRDCRKAASSAGWEYLFVTSGERYQPYRNGSVEALGVANVFFLDTAGEWRRFINRLLELLKRDKRATGRKAVT